MMLSGVALNHAEATGSCLRPSGSLRLRHVPRRTNAPARVSLPKRAPGRTVTAAKRQPSSDPIAAAILRARTTANLTQMQLAERLKTDQGNIARLERGRSEATIRTLKRIAEATAHSLIVDFRPLKKQ